MLDLQWHQVNNIKHPFPPPKIIEVKWHCIPLLIVSCVNGFLKFKLPDSEQMNDIVVAHAGKIVFHNVFQNALC